MAIRVGTTAHDLGGIRVSTTHFETMGVTFSVLPTVTARSTNSVTVSGTLLTEGDVYAVAVLQTDTAPFTPEQVIAGHNGEDSAARGAGNQETVTAFSFDITGNGLSGYSAFDIYIVGKVPQGT